MYIYTYIYIYKHIYTYIHTYIHIYIHIYTHIYTYIYIYYSWEVSLPITLKWGILDHKLRKFDTKSRHDTKLPPHFKFTMQAKIFKSGILYRKYLAPQVEILKNMNFHLYFKVGWKFGIGSLVLIFLIPNFQHDPDSHHLILKTQPFNYFKFLC